MPRNSNCRSCIGIITGWPHFLHGTVLNGGMFPGINAVLSHHPHLTIRNCSLIACKSNLAPCANPTTIFLRPNQFDKRPEMVFLLLRSKVKKMKTTFAKLMKHVPVNGWMAICQRDSRLLASWE